MTVLWMSVGDACSICFYLPSLPSLPYGDSLDDDSMILLWKRYQLTPKFALNWCPRCQEYVQFLTNRLARCQPELEIEN